MIMHPSLRFLIAALFLNPTPLFAGGLVLHSGPVHIHLLELFTSEGCSSCPPAEERFSAFQRDPRLWKELVPVEFHVDYWDNLGWPDQFASPAYTERQRGYARGWGSDSVYTPEFVLDGREFHGGDISTSAAAAGNLTATLDPSRKLLVQYQPHTGSAGGWQAHVATLGLGMERDILAGENSGRRLRHDFVAMSLQSFDLDPVSISGAVALPPAAAGERAIAVWVTRGNDPAPVQAVGGWTR